MLSCCAMKMFSPACFLATALVVSAATPETAGRAPAPEDAKKAKSEEAKLDRPSVSLGMSPEDVAKIIGRPEKSEAVTTPAGNGEEWIYRRLAKEWTQQTAATSQMMPAFVGLGMPNGGLGEVAVAVNHIERVKLYQVSSLLFIEGKLAAAKQWTEKESRIEN